MARPLTNREFLGEIGAAIAERRQARGWTQAKLAAEVGMEPRSLSRIETGAAAPSLVRLRVIATALGTSPWQLVAAGEGPGSHEALHAEIAGLPEELTALGVRILREIQAWEETGRDG